jgi:nitrate reductase NapE component
MLAPARVFDWLSTSIRSETHRDLTLRLTALVLILDGASSPLLQALLRIACSAIIVLPGVARRPQVWWFLVVAMVGCNAQEWYKIDNHKYLMTYWVLACGLWTSGAAGIHTTARLLVAVVFSLATIWKLLAGQFFDGSFLYASFFTEPRLIPVAAWVGGMPPAELGTGADAVRFMLATGEPETSLPLPRVPRLGAVAMAMSWLGILIEGSVAALHIAASRRLDTARHGALITFVVLTYFIFPVTGFASILGVIGFAQCDPYQMRAQTSYLLVLGVIQLTVVPWRSLLV